MKKTTIIPRGKYILVETDKEEKRLSEAGLATPDNEEQEKKSIGTVIAVGDVKDIKKGDRVVYGTYAGDTIKMKDEEFKLLHDDDVLAFLKD